LDNPERNFRKFATEEGFTKKTHSHPYWLLSFMLFSVISML